MKLPALTRVHTSQKLPPITAVLVSKTWVLLLLVIKQLLSTIIRNKMTMYMYTYVTNYVVNSHYFQKNSPTASPHTPYLVHKTCLFTRGKKNQHLLPKVLLHKAPQQRQFIFNLNHSVPLLKLHRRGWRGILMHRKHLRVAKAQSSDGLNFACLRGAEE